MVRRQARWVGGVDCFGWCAEDAFTDNCEEEHCFGCPECRALHERRGDKWWDPDNFYEDRSCLVWGVMRADEGVAVARLSGFEGWRLGASRLRASGGTQLASGGGAAAWQTFCSIQRPVCWGGDRCHPMPADPNVIDYGAFWCGRQHSFSINYTNTRPPRGAAGHASGARGGSPRAFPVSPRARGRGTGPARAPHHAATHRGNWHIP